MGKHRARRVDTGSPTQGEAVQRSSRVPIVALGASAGGLEAFQRFCDALPDKPGIAFVLIQHLAPDHSSLTPELLGQHTSMPVTAVKQEKLIEADCLYVIAPDSELTIHDNRLEVRQRTEDAGHWRPIDRCFGSLAEARGDGAVAVILSGTGTDGTNGARTVKDQGGLVIAQSPSEAGFRGMPESAITAEVVDHVLPIEEIPARAIAHARNRDRGKLGQDAVEREVRIHLNDLLAVVRQHAQYNLTDYRPGTPVRRIARRMELCGIGRATDYIQYLKIHPDERHHLIQDLFIGVTRFFRDPEAFEYLGENVIAKLIEDKPEGHSLRIWVAGCATGEEAYSLAIVVAECLATVHKRLNVRILATDISDEALEHARRGTYAEAAVSTLSATRLEDYFIACGQGYQIRSEIREWITFAKHDPLSDPAFATLDLISCRNVLIYLSTPVQKRVLALLHHALNPGGYMWLGGSETTGLFGDHFETVSRGWRIYRRIGPSMPQPPIREMDARDASATDETRNSANRNLRARASIGDAARRALLEDCAPASVVIDSQYNILHFHGDIQTYLDFPKGEATLHLMFMARRGLGRNVRIVAQEAIHTGKTASVRSTVQRNGFRQPVQITARPLDGPDLPNDLLLLTFLDLQAVDGTASTAAEMLLPGDESLVQQLEHELQATQQELRGHIHRLQETNDEASAMNEELQATNEELEASKEELQALNEELRTVNTDLHEKVQELEAVRNDWRNLLVSTDIATVFLDRALNVRRFTPAIKALFRLIPSDRGRPLDDIVSHFHNGETVANDARAVLETEEAREREVHTQDGRWYMQRIRPYRGADDKVNGVVVAFIDVTERKQAVLQAEAARAYAEHLINTLHEAVVVLDAELRVVSANRSFYSSFALTKEETENTRIYELGNREWDIASLRALLDNILSRQDTVQDIEIMHRVTGVGARVMLLNARRLDDTARLSSACILLAMTDITRQKHEQSRVLAASEERYQALFEAIPMMCFTATHGGQIITANQRAADILGWGPSALVGRNFIELHPEDIQQVQDQLADTARHVGTTQRWETRIQRQSGDLRWARETACIVTGETADDSTLLIVCEDLTNERQHSELAYHAAHDALTGLLNRREFERRLSRVIAADRRGDKPYVMAFIDLDQFKIVNDVGGHLAGDEVLRQVAQLLRDRVRGGDTVARLGGDEFGLLLEHCSIAEAQRLSEQLLNSIERLRFSWDVGPFPVGMSIGLTTITADTQDIKQVFQAADAACYQAKVSGRHRSYVYQAEDIALKHRHSEFAWVSRVSRALEENRLRLFYQPIRTATADTRDADHHDTRYEFLLRLIDASGRYVPAAKFLPAAERYGLASRLDQWVINNAFDWLRDNPTHVGSLEQCAINLSAQSLTDKECLHLLRTRLTDGSVPPHKICLEITETAAINHLNNAREAIETLRTLGCRFALDDFGSGLSSFGYLKTLPTDILKIDGSLMQSLIDDARDLAIVKSLNEIAHLMGKQTVAEGVEDTNVLEKLREIGVDFVQGYLLGAPQSLDDLVSSSAP